MQQWKMKQRECPRNYYFVSKIIFSAVTAGLFALLGIITLAIGEMNSPYPFIDIQFTYYIKVFTQAFITLFLYSLFLMALVFLIRKCSGDFCCVLCMADDRKYNIPDRQKERNNPQLPSDPSAKWIVRKKRSS
jgi:hypothetical protein